MEEKAYVNKGKLGKSIFAKRDIKKGEEILKFTGPLITFEQLIAKGERQGDPLQIGPGKYVDSEEPGRSANHSCDPNAGLKEDVVLIAIKDIGKDEEITFDYSTTMDEDFWTMECNCGNPNCRRLVKDFKYLLKNIQQKYLKLGIVQKFIPENSQEVMALLF